MTARLGGRRTRDAVFRTPTIEGACELWPWEKLGPPDRPQDALAAIHLARLKWEGATSAMVAESIAWLGARGYEARLDEPIVRQ